MKRRVTAIVAALALAITGTFVIVSYVNAAEDRALAGERTVDVLVVGDAVPKGTSASDLAGNVTVEKVPAKVRASDAIGDLEALGDKVAAVDLLPGEQVISGRFVDPKDLEAVGQTAIPDGLQQVSIALDPERALGGRINAGDTVAVTASFEMTPVDESGNSTGTSVQTTHMILHKVLVTNVQRVDNVGDDENQTPTSDLLVTLALDAGSVERVVFSAEHGSVWLSHEPKDAPEGGTKIQTGSVIFQ